jgi:iron complex outermembrane receptor protein
MDSSQEGLEEIVVTAQRRSENVQRVPIAVTAVTAGQLQSQGVLRTNDLPRLAPGLVINRENNTPQIFLRGIGTPNSAPGYESAVATYVDGVYIGVPIGASLSLSDVERIEVIKGPQGTLFGRNATAGVLQVITRDPSQHQGLDFYASYGRFSAVEAGVYGGVRMSDRVAAGLSVDWRRQYDGWGTNLYSGEDAYKGKEISLRGKVKIEPADTTTITLSGDYMYNMTDIGSNQRLIRPSKQRDAFIPGYYDIRHDFPGYTNVKSYGAAGTVVQNIGSLSLISITAWRKLRSLQSIDSDQSSVAFIQGSYHVDFEQFSQEVRLTSKSGGKFDWMLGGFYFAATAEVPDYSVFVVSNVAKVTGKQNLKSYAAFAQGTLAITDTTKLTGGARYTIDRRNFEGTRQVGTAPIIVKPLRYQKDTQPSFRLSLDQSISGDSMVYASYNRSFRGGGFNATSPLDNPIKPETIDAYEVGAKLGFLDRRVRLNAAAFLYNLSDIQLQQTIGGIASTYNASAARVKGVEADFTAIPFKGLTLRVAGTLLNGKYTRFPGAPRFTALPTTGAVSTPIDGSGLDTLRTPKLSGAFSLDYVVPVSIGSLRFSGNVYHTDSYWVDAGNSFKQAGYNLVGASAGWSSSDETRSLTLWTRNLFGQKYCDRVQVSSNGFGCGAGEPMTFGVTGRLRFH